ncbi:transcription termination factor Rho [Helcococcus ovis]|uniref:Transcription termination factor Rho n=2 Tax=Helcococcus ovis TaxID=72026 RepID=A0A4R9C0N0_9FIRM|nr:transcription termination factor Rho [Helcococcus ovis]TFF64001.1 transcription termination factor Rho [Helcococcus ovis]TFF64372.1 transcription termination factor Rho [Helcococcus ovis]TFF67882.1 transcription termination factor Rho [Helcococcus ovis]WNZ01568.1 transcription termination factor Rho [Helcococcus ovis]
MAENLKSMKLNDLRELAKSLNIKSITKYSKDELISLIETVKEDSNSKNLNNLSQENQNLKNNSQQANYQENTNKDTIEIKGLLEVLPDGYGFIRTNKFESGDNDVFVSPTQIRRFKLKTGDYIKGLIRPSGDEKEKFPPLIYVLGLNGHSPENAYKRNDFETLKPIYPTHLIDLEDEKEHISNRMINMIAPIGKGQRGLIVSPPKTGKTTIIKNIANAIEKNHPEIKIFILLIDERPEEVTDIERSVNKFTEGRDQLYKTEIIASTFDEQLENHARLSEMTLERAKRLVEEGKDVVILLDSITRMARAYNILTPSSGKTLSGGLDPIALHKPKRFFGAARNIEEGGSLTILATCLVDTGSRMDDMIYEEFKGTGNMELHLDRSLSEMRIFPAINILKSGTRRDDLLLDEETREAFVKVRRMNKDTKEEDSLPQLIKLFENSKNNEELLKIIKKI